MNLLCVETSTRNLSVAVAKDEKVLKFCNAQLSRPLDRSIMPCIKKMLDGSQTPVEQLDGFAVGLGPGSFTSLRVGLSTIKGLAFAVRKPVVGICSLDVLAMSVKEDAQICTLCDAKRNLVFACLYQKEGPTLKRKSDYVLAGVNDVLKNIKGRTVFLGDGVPLYQDNIRKAKMIIPKYADGKTMFPQARHLVPLALKRFQKKEWDDVARLIPLYLYPDHCQIREKGNKKRIRSERK